MPVYVDNMEAKFGRMKMSHMMADTLEELHEMAYKIGLKREWFQNHKKYPHYDVSLSKRNLAIKHGAREVTPIELVKIMRRKVKIKNGDSENRHVIGVHKR